MHVPRDSRSAPPWALIAFAAGLLLGCEARQVEEPIRVVPQAGPIEPRRVAFSPSDPTRLLVVDASGTVGLWNVAEPQRPVLLASLAAGAMEARFAPDGRLVLSTGSDGRVSAWSLTGRLEWRSEIGHEGKARSLAVGTDRIVSGGNDGKLRVWTLDGKPAGDPLNEHKGTVVSVDVAPDGRILSAATDETIRLWQPTAKGAMTYRAARVLHAPGEDRTPWLTTLIGRDPHWGWDRAVAFSRNGTIVAAAFDGTLRRFDASGAADGEPLKGHGGHHVRAVTFSPNGEFFVSAGFNGEVQLWNADGTARGVPIKAHTGPALSVSIAPDASVLVTTGDDNRVRIWKLDGVRVAELPAGRAAGTRSVALTATTPLLAAGDTAGSVRIWNLDGSAHGRAIQAHRGVVSEVTFSSQGNLLATAGQDSTVKLWNLDGTPRTAPIGGHSSEVMSVAISPDGGTVATGSRMDPVQLWNADGSARGVKLSGLRDAVFGLTFSPDGQLIAAADLDGHFWIWRLDGTAYTHELKGHYGSILEIAFSPGGTQLASAGHDGTVRLWQTDGTALAELIRVPDTPMRSVAFSPRGDLLAAGGDDGNLYLWTLPSRQLQTQPLGGRVDQVGFVGGVLWARVSGNIVRFFDARQQTVATIVLGKATALVFTADGWLSGVKAGDPSVRLFRGPDAVLSDAEVAARISPDKVMAVILGGER